MRAVIQRVSSAQVEVEGEVVGRCGQGFMVLAAVHKEDQRTDAIKLAEKVAGLRLFNDAEGKMNLALADLPEQDLPQVLAISQFTLFGDASGSRRPSFVNSAGYEKGKEYFDLFAEELSKRVKGVETGVFGASMRVSLCNEGPVTLILDVGPSLPKG
jgi:D-tyrosyl-tRNA(Tyr) deacylase